LRLVNAAVPGATPVNHIPILRYLPTWFPGARFHKFAAETKELTTQMKEVPFKWTQEKMVSYFHFAMRVFTQYYDCSHYRKLAPLLIV
jgi:hypothetical protein